MLSIKISHTSKDRPNDTVRSLDKRHGGWKWRAETFRKKTEVLMEMLKRCRGNGIDARVVLFDSWFANDGLIAKIVEIGYGVICRLKATKTLYTCQGKAWSLKELRREAARRNPDTVPGWDLKAEVLNVGLPPFGNCPVGFCTLVQEAMALFFMHRADLPPAEVLDYYARSWAIEVRFRDAKQLLALGQGQSECFDALIAWTSIVMIRCFLPVYIPSRKQGLAGPWAHSSNSLHDSTLSWRSCRPHGTYPEGFRGVEPAIFRRPGFDRYDRPVVFRGGWSVPGLQTSRLGFRNFPQNGVRIDVETQTA